MVKGVWCEYVRDCAIFGEAVLALVDAAIGALVMQPFILARRLACQTSQTGGWDRFYFSRARDHGAGGGRHFCSASLSNLIDVIQ